LGEVLDVGVYMAYVSTLGCSQPAH